MRECAVTRKIYILRNGLFLTLKRACVNGGYRNVEKDFF